MIATLLVVIILGVVAAIVITQESPSTPMPSPGANGSTTTTVPHTVGSGADLAARAACEADFVALTTALNDYRALNGSLPGPGTSWAISAANGGPLLVTWPSEPRYFSITWNGSALSVIPVRGTSSHGTAGSVAAKTGCFSI